MRGNSITRCRPAVCDVFEPWRHGTVVRATRFPDYFDFNVVRVEEDPGMSAEALAAFADQALDGLRHRRMDFEDSDAAARRYGPGFEALGWMTERLVWMRHETPPPAGPDIAVEEVPYDEAVHRLQRGLVLRGLSEPRPRRLLRPGEGG